MMFLRLNLLSPKKKTRFMHLAKFLFVKEILEYIIFTCVLLAIFHLLGWLVLTQSLNDLAQSAILINRSSPAINEQIRTVNRTAKQVLVAAEGFELLTPRLVELFEALPPTIKLSRVIMNRADSTLTLNGTAKTRDDLLAFQESLRKISWLEPATAPQSQLFQKDNVSFEINAKIKILTALKPAAARGGEKNRRGTISDE